MTSPDSSKAWNQARPPSVPATGSGPGTARVAVCGSAIWTASFAKGAAHGGPRACAGRQWSQGCPLRDSSTLDGKLQLQDFAAARTAVPLHVWGCEGGGMKTVAWPWGVHGHCQLGARARDDVKATYPECPPARAAVSAGSRWSRRGRGGTACAPPAPPRRPAPLRPRPPPGCTYCRRAASRPATATDKMMTAC